MCDNTRLTITRTQRDRMIAHARAEAPNECCGLLLGRQTRVERVIPMTSDLPSPDAYYMNPEQQIAVFSDMHLRGEQLLGIYHSHPTGPAEPSGADLQTAVHHGVVYFIISLADERQPELRAFMLRRDGFTECAYSVTGE